MYSIAQGSVASQAVISVNVDVHPNLHGERKISMEMASKDDVIIDPASVSKGGLSIIPGEIVVAERKPCGEIRFGPQRNVVGFSSFAGLVSPTKDQRAWESRFTALGISRGQYDDSGESNNATGVSCQKGGSGSLINSSNATISFGDVIAAQFPFLDAQKRKEQYHVINNRLRPGLQSAFSKPIATVKIVSSRDIPDSFNATATRVVSSRGGISVPEFNANIRTAQVESGLSSEMQRSAALKQFILTGGMALVQALVEHGYVVTTAKYGSNPLENLQDLVNWNQSIASVSADGVKESKNHRWIPGPTTDVEFVALRTALAAAGPADAAAIRTAYDAQAASWTSSGRFVSLNNDPAALTAHAAFLKNSIGALAVVSGLVSSSTNPSIVENIEVSAVATTRTLYGSIHSLRGYTEIGKILFTRPTDDTIVNALGTIVSIQPGADRQLQQAYKNAGPLLCSVMGDMFDSVYRNVLCRATSTAAPGELFDFAS